MEQKIQEIEQWYDKNKTLYEQFSKEIEEIITKILKSKGISYQSVSHRVKEKESYLNKCKKEKYTDPLKQITDISGIRIIAYTNRDVKAICEILLNEFCVDESNSENKADILETDKVGYLSVHYILQLSQKRLELPEYKLYEDMRCEVQVRTLLQHAWAEIEHDRNYKFAGVLPREIKRRFYLIAGVLEMMDGEFDKLSEDIDEYAKSTQKAVLKGNYDLEIDSKSVEQYLLKKFENADNITSCSNNVVVTETVVEELIKFGYKKIWEIEDDINYYMCAYEEEDTYIGLLRTLMMLKDCKKYFEKAYGGAWQSIERTSVRFLEEHGVKDIHRYLYENRIDQVDSDDEELPECYFDVDDM